MTPHSAAVNRVRLYLSELGCMVARRDVGMYTDFRGQSRHVGVVGEADIQGTTAYGRALAVEVKCGKDTVKPHQEAWARAWESRRALYAVVRVDDTQDWKNQLCALVEGGKHAGSDQLGNREVRPTEPPHVNPQAAKVRKPRVRIRRDSGK